MIQPHIIENFVPNDVIKALNDWVIEKIESDLSFFSDANMGLKGTRLTTRYYKDCSKLVYPQQALELREKIAAHLNITDARIPKYCHGIACGVGFNDGDIFNHLDPVYYKDTYTLHCNVITQKADEGGITVIEGVPYPTKPNDVLVYPVSKVKHNVTKIKGNTPRILWVFGYCINERQVY